jgi:hypothetical protein
VLEEFLKSIRLCYLPDMHLRPTYKNF